MSTIQTTRRTILVTLVALACLAPEAGPAQDGQPQPELPTETLTIETKNGPVRIEAEMATKPSQQARGLMFRETVPEGTGMLFLYDQPRRVSMWMRNTPTSLDMLFIDEQGRITKIRARTTPFSEDVISASTPVTAVLELKGGEAARQGISLGDKVRHEFFAD